MSDVLILTRIKGASVAQGSDVDFKPLKQIVENGEWNGIPIVKEAPDPGMHNPITVQDVINSLNFFAIPASDVQGLAVIIISGRSPYSDEMNAGWAFGAYQVIWEETRDVDPTGKRRLVRKPRQNRLILWAQQIDLVRFNVGGEVRQGYYYRVQPNYQGQKVDRYLSVRAMRREILGDTLIHEIGHHVDIWLYGRYIESSKDRAKAEKYAEQYSKAYGKNKVNTAEFEAILEGGSTPPQGGTDEAG